MLGTARVVYLAHTTRGELGRVLTMTNIATLYKLNMKLKRIWLAGAGFHAASKGLGRIAKMGGKLGERSGSKHYQVQTQLSYR